jgi:hypothetical protein
LSAATTLANTAYNLGYPTEGSKSILGRRSEAGLGTTEGSEALEELFDACAGLEAEGEGVGCRCLNAANYRRAGGNRGRNKGARSLSPRFRGWKGFLGWGRSTFLPFRYWRGSTGFEADRVLNARGGS